MIPTVHSNKGQPTSEARLVSTDAHASITVKLGAHVPPALPRVGKIPIVRLTHDLRQRGGFEGACLETLTESQRSSRPHLCIERCVPPPP